MSTQTISYDPNATFELKVFDETYRNVGGEDWPVRIYQPQGPGPFPALIGIHGGAWSNGTNRDNERIERAIAETGILVAAIAMRQAPDHPYPAQVNDANYGTRWLKANAARLNADPSSVGGFGTSSGGHTLMLSVLRATDPTFAGDPVPGGEDRVATLDYVILGWPVLDSWARYQYAVEADQERLKTNTENYFKTADAIQEGNPQRVLECSTQVGTPPVLILQGTNDSNVPLAISERFVETYAAAGGSAQRELFLGMPHGFARDPGPETDRAIALAKAFLAEQLNRG